MKLTDVWNIVLCIVGSAGGIGVIIAGVVKFCSNIIAERLSQKYNVKLQKELEQYKSGLDNKIYISKAKFDAEFDLYRQLSKAFFEMVKDVTIMIPTGYATYPANPEKRKEYEDKMHQNACKSTVEAQDVLNSNIPFMPEDFYNKYSDILRLCRQQLDVYEMRWNVYYIASQKEKETFSHDDYQRSRDINTDFKELNSNIRDYLAKLDVID